MVLSKKTLFIFSAFIILLSTHCDGDINTNDKNFDSDDDQLKEALILVDLLKSEYLKVIDENAKLRNSSINRTTLEEPPMNQTDNNGTTAITTVSNADNGNTGTGLSNPQQPPMAPWLELVPSQLPQMPFVMTPRPRYARNLDFPYMNYRRMMPSYFYYDAPIRKFYNQAVNQPFNGENKMRRMEYDDQFGPPPSRRMFAALQSVPPVNLSTSTSTTAAVHTDRTTVQSTSTKIIKKSAQVTPKTLNNIVKLTLKTNNYKSNYNKLRYKTKGHKTKTTVKANNFNLRTRDPIMIQVERELNNELDETRAPKNKRIISEVPTKSNDLQKASMKQRSTLRVHLAQSSRLSIPLPENHAFCFFNPNSALCHTYL